MKKKIYTKFGDKGQTLLLCGSVVQKSHERIEAYGTIDELNSVLGMILNYDIPDFDKKLIINIQNKLFDIGAILAAEKDCIKNLEAVSNNDIDYLEVTIDNFEIDLPKIKNFILPSGSRLISWCNIARTICRRAERRITCIKNYQKKYLHEIIYINRLSDLLFIMSRKYAKQENIEEIFKKNF